MRRKDRELLDKADLENIIRQADVCRIAFFAEKAPYIVPLNFGYAWNETLKFYFHCAQAGRKLELLKTNNVVGFEIDIKHELLTGDVACDWGMKYRSVIGNGKINELADEEDKVRGLDLIMKHFGYAGSPSYSKQMLGAVKVLCLKVDEITGKAKL